MATCNAKGEQVLFNNSCTKALKHKRWVLAGEIVCNKRKAIFRRQETKGTLSRISCCGKGKMRNSIELSLNLKNTFFKPHQSRCEEDSRGDRLSEVSRRIGSDAGQCERGIIGPVLQ